MQTYRMVSQVFLGRTLERDRRTRLIRYLGPESETACAPYILMDSIHLDTVTEFADGFPWKPYLGVEAIWYFHAAPRDPHKAQSMIAEPHWIAAANGEVRDQLPDLGGAEIGNQLWMGLPPEMADVQAEIPIKMPAPVVSPSEGTDVRIIGGVYEGETGSLGPGLPGALYLDVYIAPHATWTLETEDAQGVMVAFLTAGEVFFGPDEDEIFSEERAVLFTPGTTLQVKATHHGGRFLLLYSPQKGAPVLDMAKVQKSESDWIELLHSEEDEA